MQVFEDPAALEEFCKRNGIKTLSVFGSTLKGTATPQSDVDLLVAFEPTAKPSLLDLVRMELELSELIGGKKVDLRTAGDLSRYFRDDVVTSAVVQYAA
ncbi:MAG: polymerase beta domain protein region [Rhizobium sp.]|nr:polymerase beta domain protein region [Rhizobium sp.]